jgi:hypothetical protein
MVVVPGTTLDTRNPNDVFAITEMVALAGKMTLTQLNSFGLALSQIPQPTEFEQKKLLPLVLVAKTRLENLKRTYDNACQEGSIWCVGTLFYYDETGKQQPMIQTEVARASREYKTLRYATRALNIDAATIELSLGDSEIKVLEDLSDFIQDPNRRPDVGVVHLFQRIPSRLYIIISSNMGPCTECQGRIEQFIYDLQAQAEALTVQIPLILDVNYVTETNVRNRAPYGYMADLRVQVGAGGDGHLTNGSRSLPDDFFYYSKSFRVTL